MTEQPEKKKVRTRSRAEADALAAEYEASGLSRQEFCQRRQVALKTLARYIVQHRKRHAPVTAAPRSRLLRVQVEPPNEADSELSVVLVTGRRIAVKPGFDAELLRQLLAVLEQT